MRALAVVFVLLLAACGEPGGDDIPCSDFRVMFVYRADHLGFRELATQRVCVVAEVLYSPSESK